MNVGSNGGSFSSPLGAGQPDRHLGRRLHVQPENGGLGVFAHEFGHDLGLPDLYDTSGNTGGAENSTGVLDPHVLRRQHRRRRPPRASATTRPTWASWELFQLGWLNAQDDKGPFYEVVEPARQATHQLATNVPASKKGAQAVFAVLPDNEVPLDLGEPATGRVHVLVDQGDDLNNTMTNVRVRVRPDGEGELRDRGGLGLRLPRGDRPTAARPGPRSSTNLSDSEGDQSGINPNGTGITGVSDGWVDLTATLAGRDQRDPVPLLDRRGVRAARLPGRRRHGRRHPVGTAETEDEGWTFDGFLRATGDEVQSFFNAYVMENRQYDGYDKSLKTAYNFGFLNTNKPDKVETYPYQAGMLLSYWNDEYTDNNVGDHPGEGLLLPVDSHPGFSHWRNGDLMRPRILSYDSTFGLEKTDSIRLHLDGKSHRHAVEAGGVDVR